MTDYPCTWWEKIGMTDWEDLPSGGRMRSSIYRNLETKQELPSYSLPIGALYAVERGSSGPDDFPPVGADGLAIACVCIGDMGPDSRYHWYIDYRASNCDKKDDKVHRCWVRHGTVGEKLTVDKSGNTCGAGAGSFFMDAKKWHGFLQNGVLVQR